MNTSSNEAITAIGKDSKVKIVDSDALLKEFVNCEQQCLKKVIHKMQTCDSESLPCYNKNLNYFV